MARHPEQREVLLPVNLLPFVLHAGDTVSDPLAVTTGTLVAVIMPDAWDPPAFLSLQVSYDGGVTFYDMFMRNREVMLNTAEPGIVVNVADVALKNVYVRLRSGLRNSPTPQSADRNFTAVIEQ